MNADYLLREPFMSAPPIPIVHNKRPVLLPSSWVLWLVRGLALIAISLASYLTWVTLVGGSVPGCSVSGFDCDFVLTSEWSKWFNLPISLGGVLVYGGIFLASWLWSLTDRHEVRLFAWMVTGCLSSLAALSGIWFLILQFQIGKFCFYCLLTHVCGIAIAAVTWISMPKGLRRVGPPRGPHIRGTMSPRPVRASQSVGLEVSHLVAVGLMTLVGLVSLVTGQILSEHKTYTTEELVSAEVSTDSDDKTSTTPGAKDGVESGDGASVPGTRTEVFKPVISGSRQFIPGIPPMEIDALPVYGDPNAEHLILKFMSYTCPHCRKVHHQLDEALQKLGTQFAVVIRPIALSQRCNHHVLKEHPMHVYSCQFTRLALAVWHADRTKFPAYHEYLMADEKNMPPLEEAKRFAAELIGIRALKEEVRHPIVLQMLQENHELMHAHAQRLPTLVIGKQKMQGMTKTTAELTNIIRDEFPGKGGDT